MSCKILYRFIRSENCKRKMKTDDFSFVIYVIILTIFWEKEYKNEKHPEVQIF
jgi:hypothetical protein